MVRGKYATRAEKTRHVQDQDASLQATQQQLMKLIAENKRLSKQLEEERDARVNQVSRLKAQLDEGVSPELQAARLLLTEARSDASTARQERKKTLEQYRRFAERLLKHFHAEHGMTPVEAVEQVLAWTPEELSTTTYDPDDLRKLGMSKERVRALQRVRGDRH